MKNALYFVWRYILTVLIAVDQLGNAILAGDPDETISSRIGKEKIKQGGVLPWSRPITKLTDMFLEKLDKNHCIEAIQRKDK
jgi:hypothetical protein